MVDRPRSLLIIILKGNGQWAVMFLEAAETLRTQTRRVLALTERAVLTDVKRELASIAAALAQLAEALERDGDGSES